MRARRLWWNSSASDPLESRRGFGLHGLPLPVMHLSLSVTCGEARVTQSFREPFLADVSLCYQMVGYRGTNTAS